MLLRLKKNRKGFTLIELIVVVAIIAILAAIAVPNFIGMQDKAKQGVRIANATAIASAISTYNATVATHVLTSKAEGSLDALSDIFGTGLVPTTYQPTFTGVTAAEIVEACKLVSTDANGVASVNNTY